MNKFPWGKVIDILQIDLDGDKVEITKYHPYFDFGTPARPKEVCEGVEYHIEELHSAYHSVQAALIGYMAYKSLGLNQHALVSGICRALDIKE